MIPANTATIDPDSEALRFCYYNYVRPRLVFEVQLLFEGFRQRAAIAKG